MARAKDAVQVETPLYERDSCLWVEEQARLLKEGRLEQLDVVNLIDEIEDLSIDRKHAVTSNLVVILKRLLKHQHQPRRRSQKLAGINRGAPAAAAQAIPARPEPSRLRA